MTKAYLGDGVYADFDGYAVVLTTENGISVTNTIVLEPEVYEALVAYRQHLEDIARRNSREEDDCREAQDNTPSKEPFKS